jgi:hypothetical protein
MSQLFNLASDYGLPFVILVFIGYVLYVYGKHRLFPHVKDSLRVEKLDSTAKLSYHSLFATINHRLNSEIPTLDLLPHKPVKQQMIRDLLSIYIRALFKVCKEIAETDMKDWAPEVWQDEIIKKISSINTEFVNNCKAHGIPDIVVEKFFRWNKSTQDIMFDGIMSLGSSAIFNSNVARTNSLFFMVNLILVTTIADAEKTLKELNGDVHGQFYNGKMIEE